MSVTPVYQNSDATVALPFKGVILDMDGTLIESTEADYLAWKWVFADYNIPFTFEEYQPMLGTKSVDVIKARLTLNDEELAKALKQKMAYFKEVVTKNGIEIVPFADKLFNNLKKYPVKIALATSSRREKMNLLMEKVQFIQHFDAIVTGEEVHNGKPAPDIFLQAAERLQLAPEDCVVVEDTVAGVKAGKNANMKCVAIATTHPAHLLHEADLVINTFENADLLEWCKLMANN
jgi:beta-phosphoglucomutase family hydrolase